jgi:hypothetical protein
LALNKYPESVNVEEKAKKGWRRHVDPLRFFFVHFARFSSDDGLDVREDVCLRD